MTPTAWSEVNADAAESDVRHLRGAIAETESEIGAYRQLGSTEQLPFALMLGLSSLQSRRDQLEEQLHQVLSHRERELITLALDGPDYPRHTAAFESLSSILRSTQGLFTSVVQAVTTGSTSRGPVPSYVSELSKLRLVTTFPSSFGLAIEARTNNDAKAQATLERSLSSLFSLLENADNPDRLLEDASVLGPRVMGHLQSLVWRLHRTKTQTQLGWSDSAGTSRKWMANDDNVSAMAVSLSGIREPEVVTKVLSGILLGLSLLKGTFEILSDRGELIEGSVAEDILELARMSFGTRKKFVYTETSTKNQLTGSVRTASKLVRIQEPEEALGIEGLASF